jgi:bifunctional non-homologous end joining protein LigD
VLPFVSPMPLAPASAPFSDPGWIFEPKWDGFRALAYVDRRTCKLVSRRGNPFTSWPELAQNIAKTIRRRRAVLDGEICCLDPKGRSAFYDLLFRRGQPHFMAFDVLWLDGRDLRGHSLEERKQILTHILGDNPCVRVVEHIERRGADLFRAACQHDLEGIVAKWRPGTYQSGPRTSWVKIRNPHYSQWDGRRDLFEARRDNAQRRRRQYVTPRIALI